MGSLQGGESALRYDDGLVSRLLGLRKLADRMVVLLFSCECSDLILVEFDGIYECRKMIMFYRLVSSYLVSQPLRLGKLADPCFRSHHIRRS